MKPRGKSAPVKPAGGKADALRRLREEQALAREAQRAAKPRRAPTPKSEK